MPSSHAPPLPGTEKLRALFPIPTQTSDLDKEFLLNAGALVAGSCGSYSYLEIGSFLGGSLAPFLVDPSCKSALSVDDRGLDLVDERGIAYDYAGVTSATMIDGLAAHGISTAKLAVHDGPIDTAGGRNEKYQLAFIDGEHTDTACFRDFLWAMKYMDKDAVVMFHDSVLIYRALQMIFLHLDAAGSPFSFLKKRDSAMSAVMLGKFKDMDAEAVFGPREPDQEFFSRSEARMLRHQVKNRVRIGFHPRKLLVLKIKPPKPVKAF